MHKEVLALHDEEIKNIKYIYYQPDFSIEQIHEDLKDILLIANDITYTYIYVENKCSYYLFIPSDNGETILSIEIKRVIKHIDMNMINEQYPLLFASPINSKYCIEITRRKGISNYKAIRKWLIDRLEEYGWIKASTYKKTIKK